MSTHHLSSQYGGSHHLSSHYGRLGVVPTEPEVIHPMGSDPHAAALRGRILREDEEILAVLMAFMQIKDD
jgi:hypothetical protein